MGKTQAPGGNFRNLAHGLQKDAKLLQTHNNFYILSLSFIHENQFIQL
jgi:hypothetical protein